MADVIDELGTPNAVTLSMIRGKADHRLGEWLDDRRNGRQFHHRIGECGYVLVRNTARADGYWKIRGKRQAVYARAELYVRERHAAAAALVEGRAARFDYGNET